MNVLKNIFFFNCLLICSCNHSSINPDLDGLRLIGRTNKVEDGTTVFVTDILSNQILDSIIIYNNAFEFKRKLSASPQHLYLHTKDYAETRTLWAENEEMFFDAADSNFEDAKITGSVTQTAYEVFLAQIKSIQSDEEVEEMAKDFIKKYPDNRFSASMLAGYSPNWEKKDVQALFDLLSEENRKSVYGNQITKYLNLNRKHDIGDQFTDFEMKTVNGAPLKLSENLGRITLLEFWASWCGPCRTQNPELVNIYEKYNRKGFEIFAVSLDFSKGDWVKAIEQDRLKWNHVSDLKGRNSTAGIIYGVNAIPDNYLINEDGEIIGKYVWGEKLIQLIEQEFSDPKGPVQ